jgi:hypothetical protein
MEEKAKIRINLTSREFEVEGSEEFITKYDETIASFLEKIYLEDDNRNQSKTNSGVEQSKVQITNTKTIEVDDNNDDIDDSSFGELYNKLPNSAKDVDKMLLAGYFVQLSTDDKVFTTRAASGLLLEQGVKLTNPSASMKANMSTKKVFKHKGHYRISETGISYIKGLISNNN